MRRRFAQVDVFATGAFSGNPLAVVVDAEGLDAERMQAFTRWTNLSEVTFLLPPTAAEADYRVRIFTLGRELPFAGHPTLGSAAVWLDAGGVPAGDGEVVQQCGAGLVRVRVDGEDRFSFEAPPLVRDGPVDEPLLDDVRTLLGIDADDVAAAAWVDNGPGWLGLLLHDAGLLGRLAPSMARWRRGEPVDVGVAALLDADAGPDLEVRAFFGDHRGALVEDPVTGSLNASLGQWLTSAGVLDAPYVARQGTRLGRAGEVRVTRDAGGAVWVGGRVRHHVRGEVDLG